MENEQDLQTQLPVIKPKSADEIVATSKWQKLLLPWLIALPTFLICMFLYMANQQVNTFNRAIEIKPDSLLMTRILSPGGNQHNSSLENDKQYLQWVSLAYLEQESMYRRYKQGGFLIMSRVFVKYLGFFTGMILAIVGAVFIIGKLSEDYSGVQGSVGAQAKVNIVSSSPGIIFGILGTILMLFTVIQHNEVTIQDSPLYLNANGIISINASNYLNEAKRKKVKEILDPEDFYNPDSLINEQNK